MRRRVSDALRYIGGLIFSMRIVLHVAVSTQKKECFVYRLMESNECLIKGVKIVDDNFIIMPICLEQRRQEVLSPTSMNMSCIQTTYLFAAMLTNAVVRSFRFPCEAVDEIAVVGAEEMIKIPFCSRKLCHPASPCPCMRVL